MYFIAGMVGSFTQNFACSMFPGFCRIAFQLGNDDDQTYNDMRSFEIMLGHIPEGVGLTTMDQMAQN